MRLSRTFLLLLCLIMLPRLQGQVKKLDSLFMALKRDSRDTSQFKTLITIGTTLGYIKPDSAFDYLWRAKSIAFRLNDELKISKAYICIGWNHYLIGNNDSAEVLTNKAAQLSQKHFPDKDPIKARRAKSLYANAIANLALFLTDKGENDKALIMYTQAIALNTELSNKNALIRNLGSLGNLYTNLGNYNKALEYFLTCLKLCEAVGDKESLAVTLACLGSVYLYENNSEKALDYFFKAFQQTEALGNKRDLSPILNNIAIIYTKQHNDAQAEEYYLKAYAINVETGDKYGQSLNLGNIADVYVSKKQYDKALDYLFRGLKLAVEVEDKVGESIKLIRLGYIYSKTNRFKDAERVSLQALKIAEDIRSIEAMRNAHGSLSSLYEGNNNPALAFGHYKSYIMYRDSLFNEENTKKAVQLQMQFDFDKKQTADSLKVAEERKVSSLRFEQEKKQRYGLYGGLVLVIAFSGFMFNRFKVTQKQKRIIELKEHETQKQNRIISHQKELVEEKQKEILDSITYAQRIQNALITSESYIERELKRLQKD